MYAILMIAIVGFLCSWFLLRRFMRIWIQRPMTHFETMVAWMASWMLLLSLVAWLGGNGLLLIRALAAYKILDISIVVFSLTLTGLIVNYFLRSRPEFYLDKTKDFFIDAVQFRHSPQRRLDVRMLIQEEQRHKTHHPMNNSDSEQRDRLQSALSKDKELSTQLALLREGTSVDIGEVWRLHTESHSSNLMYKKIQEVRVDPNKKRFSLFADFPELSNEHLNDDTSILRLNRQLYDFLQSLNAEPWLKPYAPFFDNYFMVCRTKKINNEGTEFFYPFMKVAIAVSVLQKLEGSYFNPRQLSKISELDFNQGAPL
jgi:hypothetical protein